MKSILPTVFMVVIGLNSAAAAEQRTFCRKTVEGWRELLRDKGASKLRHQQAAFALGCFGPEANAAVPDLIEAVRQGEIKDEAADALAWIGSGAETAVPVMIERFLKRGCQHLTGAGTFLFDDSMESSLVRIGGPAVPALHKILNGPNGDMRVCAAHALSRIGPAARAVVPSLLRAIEHPDPEREPRILVLSAIRALGRIGPDSKSAVPALMRLLEQRDTDEFHHQFDVVIALSRIGAPPVREVLSAFLRDADPFVASQLAWLGPRAVEAVPSLRGALNDKRLQLRISAAVALSHIDPSCSESIPVLIEGLNHWDDESLVVEDVFQALAALGPRAKAAIPVLLTVAGKNDDSAAAYMALVQIDVEGKNCVPALIAALKNDDYGVVDTAANCLALLGGSAKDAMPALAAAVTSYSEEVFYNGVDPQVSAARALMRIGPPALPAIPVLIKALKYVRKVRRDNGFADRDFSAAEAAAKVLGSFGPAAKAAVPALIEAAQFRDKNDDNWGVRRAAVLALGRIGPDAKAAIPFLEKIVEDDRKPSCQAEAITALYQLAPNGKQLAEKWLEKSTGIRGQWHTQPFAMVRSGEVRDRALVMGAMGRLSVEGDCLTRRALERLHWIFDLAGSREPDPTLDFGKWFEDLGVGGRLAIPALTELCKHGNPWDRMWATEALGRITPIDRATVHEAEIEKPGFAPRVRLPLR